MKQANSCGRLTDFSTASSRPFVRSTALRAPASRPSCRIASLLVSLRASAFYLPFLHPQPCLKQPHFCLATTLIDLTTPSRLSQYPFSIISISALHSLLDHTTNPVIRRTVIEEAVITQDPLRFQQIRQSVQNAISNAPAAGASPARASHSHNHSPAHGHALASPHLPQPISFSTNFSRDGSASRPAHRTTMAGSRPNVSFKASPFYKIEAPVSDVHTCDGKS